MAASYLSDYHIHRQTRVDANLSNFRLLLAGFSDEIANLGIITKLAHIMNGSWQTPLECAETALNEAGSIIHFQVQYQTMASANDNDIEFVNDQHLLPLRWQQELVGQVPGSLFLHEICARVYNMVIIYFFNTLISSLIN